MNNVLMVSLSNHEAEVNWSSSFDKLRMGVL
jgi:hypothetical protein